MKQPEALRLADALGMHTDTLMLAGAYDSAAAQIDAAAAELRRQHALILEMREALQMVGQCLAWQCFGECRSYGESVPLLGSADADRLAKETIEKASNE